MGIPRKKPPHPLVQGVKAFGKGLLSIPLALKEIPNLPKRKLLKLTGFFFMGSLAVYYITGPYQKTIYMRHYKYGEELEKVQQSSSVLGTEQPYTHSYGLDFQQVINSSRETSDNTETTE